MKRSIGADGVSSLTQNSCPSCKTSGMTTFYTAKTVPINSCLMFSTQQEAVNFPRGDVILGFCKNCGFISNMAFDPLKIDYTTLAPEEQGYSATFNKYAQELANHLVNTYDLHRKHISEIGCGRGDFLALLCELGDNYGVGIDPSTVSGGVQSKAIDRMTFIKDYYSEQYAQYLGDFMCCRHTLEHISPTADFISTVRRSIGNKNTPVFFEVPDVSRILQEVAFWDIYYEHCSYFNLKSLAQLFRSCNFEITTLEKGYFDQYLLIEAKPVNQQSQITFDGEESIENTSKLVNLFSERYQQKLKYWKNELSRIKQEKKRAIVWGSGSKCVAFMTTLEIQDEIQYIVDINPNRHGKFIPGVGKQIISPEALREYKPETIIVMNPIYCNEIKKMVEAMGISAEYLPCT
jgi:SAM-dependent methyltransferase